VQALTAMANSCTWSQLTSTGKACT
jgi:hypothetical protein